MFISDKHRGDDMTIEEVRKEQRALELAIHQLLMDFKEKTTLLPYSVELDTHYRGDLHGDGERLLNDVVVEVRLD